MKYMHRIGLLGFVSLSLAAQFSWSGPSFADSISSSQKSAAEEEGKPSARKILKRLSEGVSRITLSNGMRVVIFRRPHAPVFNGQIWVKVGGVNELPGTTGVAHLLEHMAFKGTSSVGTKDYEKEKVLLEQYEKLIHRHSEKKASAEEIKELASLQRELESLWINNEFSRIYNNHGAVGLNAATGKDYTYYTVSLPSNAFELWCWMESDRLLNPVFRQFYKELQVVIEERRMRTDDDPGGKMYEALLATAFWAHPNRLPVIGWPSDLAKLTTADVTDFYKMFYQPENMVIGIVGDIDPASAKPVLERYFGRIPKGSSKPRNIELQEEAQEGERRTVVKFDAQPRLAVAFHKPVYPHDDDLYFAVLHDLLSGGRSSIFYRELVLGKQIATSVSTSEAPGELFPSLFYVWAVPKSGVSNETLLREIQAILDRMKTKLVSEEDLKAARKRVRVDLLSSLDSNSGLARTLGHAELLWGNWEVLFDMYDKIFATSAQDLQRLAKTYFKLDNRTVVFLERKD